MVARGGHVHQVYQWPFSSTHVPLVLAQGPGLVHFSRWTHASRASHVSPEYFIRPCSAHSGARTWLGIFTEVDTCITCIMCTSPECLLPLCGARSSTGTWLGTFLKLDMCIICITCTSHEYRLKCHPFWRRDLAWYFSVRELMPSPLRRGLLWIEAALKRPQADGSWQGERKLSLWLRWLSSTVRLACLVVLLSMIRRTQFC